MERQARQPALRRLFGLFLSLSLAALALGQSTVIQASPGDTYGYDGPWNSIRVWLGNDYQQVDLLPGAYGETFVYSFGICRGAPPSDCNVQQGGTYNPDTSDTSKDLQQPLEGPRSSRGEIFRDSLSLSSFDSSTNYTVSGQLLYVYSSALIIGFPPPQSQRNETLGLLDLGSPTSDQNSTNVNATANYFRLAGVTKSASFGLHYGSVPLGIPISLTFGGYDPTRVVGKVLKSKTAGGYGAFLQLSISDISIVTTDGPSPFSGGNITGLLAGANSTLQGKTLDGVNPTPYYAPIQLPADTVSAITQHLPVTYNEAAGYYFWNAEDPMYEAITTSPTSLQFTFQNEGQQVSIKVPFALLDLTFSGGSFINNPTRYLPIRSDRCCQYEPGNYILGRAFLQAAWLGANWSPQSPSQATWWLAQAPGPNLRTSRKQLVPIQNDQFTVSPSTQVNWADTWSTLLKPMSASSGGLSTGAKAGIGVGAALGALAVIALLVGYWLYKRHQRSRAGTTTTTTTTTATTAITTPLPIYDEVGPDHNLQRKYDNWGRPIGVYEAGGEEIHEAEGPGIYEAPSQSYLEPPQQIIHEAPSQETRPSDRA